MPMDKMPIDKILIIEDEAVNQLILKQSLEQQGYNVVVASNGEAGSALIETFRPAVIICDWVMPRMSGLDVCRCVKANPAWANVFFILLTARTSLSDRIEGLDSGADDFLSKPVQPGELLARVRAGLRIYSAAQSLRELSEALQVQQQRLNAELTQAANYVTSLLPQPLLGKVQVEARFLPSQQLGGDCFDFYWLDDDHLVLYLLDVSGHGLGAALPSVSVQQVLRSQSLPHANFHDPKSVLTALNKVFQMSEQNPRFFSLWYGVYSGSQQTLSYASAGHPPAVLIYPTGNLQAELQPRLQLVGLQGQLPIGVFVDSTYVSDRVTIVPGSVLYIFSDGLYEVQSNKGVLGTHEAFSQLLIRQHQSTAKVSLTAVIDAIQSTSATTTFSDDCSIIQARF
jgi:phosphoserine phosphatase RsbU/P